MHDHPAAPTPRPAPIEPIATLPVFFKLDGRRALLAGGTRPAVWKAELLVAAGARVLVCAPAPCPEMIACIEALGPQVELVLRAWRDADFADAALAIGALESEDAQAFYDAAHRAGVPVNVIDVPRLCDFQFGTLIGRSLLVIGISTDGAAPVFGQALRSRIEALLPAEIGLWVRAAKDWRPALRTLSFAARRRFWEMFADRALAGTGRSPSDQDRAVCLEAAQAAQSATQGRIILVGVGPGDADLVTLRAVRAMQSADIILHEARIAPAILALGRREAKRIAEPQQDETAIAGAEHGGQTVAWVGLGSPDVCRRWQRRLDSLVAAGCTPEMVEGLRCATCPVGCAEA